MPWSIGLRTLRCVTIETVDVFDDAQLREAHAVTVADTGAQAYPVTWTWQEYRVAARTRDPWTDRQLVLARAADRAAIGLVDAFLPQRDNTALIWADLHILPGHEQDTDIAELLAALGELAKRRDRTAIEIGAVLDVDSRTSAKRRVLETAGFGLALTYAHRVLDLPVELNRMRSLAEELAPHHATYRLVTWRGACPEAWVDGYAELRARILIDAPDGGIGYEREAYDAARVRHEEAELEGQQRVMYTAIAVAPDGSVAGHSQLVVPGTDDVNAYQWDTLVLEAHRGHRLGLALKARNLIEAADGFGPRKVLHTWNAEQNAPMIAVNDRLGFRLVDYSGEFRIEF